MFSFWLTILALLMLLSGAFGGFAIIEWKRKEKKDIKRIVTFVVVAIIMFSGYMYMAFTIT